MPVSLLPRSLPGLAPVSSASLSSVISVTRIVLIMIQGRSEPRRGPGHRDGLLEGVQLVEVTRSEILRRRLMRPGRTFSGLCCVQDTDKTVTPLPKKNVVYISSLTASGDLTLILRKRVVPCPAWTPGYWSSPARASWPACCPRLQSAAGHRECQTSTRG